MKNEDVQVGGTCAATVGGRKVDVRVDRANPRGGWDATAVATNKKVRIKSVRQLRGPAAAEAEAPATGEPEVPPKEAAPKAKAAKPTRPAKAARNAPAAEADAEPTPRAMTCLDAAAAVLAGNGGQPMRCGGMVAAMAERGLWTTTAPTPAATLYSAILREVGRKGDKNRFRKADRGQFALNATADAQSPDA